MIFQLLLPADHMPIGLPRQHCLTAGWSSAHDRKLQLHISVQPLRVLGLARSKLSLERGWAFAPIFLGLPIVSKQLIQRFRRDR